ncbi:MAG: hypothetical protein ACI83P_000575 [Janthinobacterium sp.]|jgi:hypothetical protein
MRAFGQPIESVKQRQVLHQRDRFGRDPAILGHNGGGARVGKVRVARNIEQSTIAAVR